MPPPPGKIDPSDRGALLSYWTLQISRKMPETVAQHAATEFVSLLPKVEDVEAAARDGVWWGPCVIAESPKGDLSGALGVTTVGYAPGTVSVEGLVEIYRILGIAKIWAIPRMTGEGIIEDSIWKRVSKLKAQEEWEKQRELEAAVTMEKLIWRDLAEGMAEKFVGKVFQGIWPIRRRRGWLRCFVDRIVCEMKR